MLAVYSWEEPAWHLRPQSSSLRLTATRQVWRKLIPPCQRKRCDLATFLLWTGKSPCQCSLSVLSVEGRKAWADCLCSRATAALWQRVKGVRVSLINAQGRRQRQRGELLARLEGWWNCVTFRTFSSGHSLRFSYIRWPKRQVCRNTATLASFPKHLNKVSDSCHYSPAGMMAIKSSPPLMRCLPPCMSPNLSLFFSADSEKTEPSGDE